MPSGTYRFHRYLPLHNPLIITILAGIDHTSLTHMRQFIYRHPSKTHMRHDVHASLTYMRL